MLNTLRINDIVLVEEAEVCLRPGFNVITGETGAGKSAILKALALVLGQRADGQVLRKGAEKGSVEAAIDTNYPDVLRQLLEDAGISYSVDEPLILRREISESGKSRAFINNQMAQVSLLRSVGSRLIEMVGQHSNQELRDLNTHRQIVDAFAGLEETVVAFQAAWKKEKDVDRALHTLVHNEAQRLRQAEEFTRQLEELDDANIKEGEDEELFAEYSRLSHADELIGHVDKLYQLLQGEEGAVVGVLGRQLSLFNKVASLDASLGDARQAYQNAVLELEEVASTLRDYSGRLDNDPGRLAFLDDRLATIAQLKKKYGPSIQEVLVYRNHVKQQLAELNNADERIEELQKTLDQAKLETTRIANNLTEKRTQATKKLGTALVSQLRSLNMPKVDVRIH